MGTLTTFAIESLRPDLADHASELVHELGKQSRKESRAVHVGSSRIRIHRAGAYQPRVYIQTGGELHAYRFIGRAALRQVLERHDGQLTMQERGMAQGSYLPNPQYAKSLDEALLVGTIRSSHFSEASRDPCLFVRGLLSGFEELLSQDAFAKASRIPGDVRLQKPLCRDAEAIYLSAEDGVKWFDANSPFPNHLREQVPHLYRVLRRMLKG